MACCSISAACCSSWRRASSVAVKRRALSMATAARPARSRASSRSRSAKRRPDPACTSVSAPSGSPRTARGTTSTERIPSPRSSSQVLGTGGVAGERRRRAARGTAPAGRCAAPSTRRARRRRRGDTARGCAGPRRRGRDRVLHGDAAEHAAGLQQVHGAPVRQPRHGEPGHAPQRGFQLQRAGQHAAGLRQEAALLLHAPPLGDVLQQPHGVARLPLLAADQRHGEAPPQRPAVGAQVALVDLVRAAPPSTSSVNNSRSSAMSSGWLTPSAPRAASSSAGYPSISARAALTATSRPSASAMDMPIPAASKSERKRASLSRSACSARWRAVTSRRGPRSPTRRRRDRTPAGR